MRHQRQTDGMRKLLVFKKQLSAFFGLMHFTCLFAQEGIITGKVTTGSEYVSLAVVNAGNKSSITNNSGEFMLSLIPGSYTLTVTHLGYKKAEKEIIVKAGHKQAVNIVMIRDEQLGEVVIVGYRSITQKTNLNTLVPVDVYTDGRLVETGQLSLTQMMNFLAPSFNASREVLHEPATLRGLDPQHLLILINGIRYHNMAWLFSGGLRGQLGKGSVGNDLNSIPFPSIERVEVLRDGASAQYGSDAIGGVLNIILKTTTGKTTIQTHIGQFYKGDGEKYSVGLYHGFPLKNNQPQSRQGFMAISGAIRNQLATFRGGTYEGPVYLNYPSAAGSRMDSLKIKMLDDSIVQSRSFNRRTIIDNAGNTKLLGLGLVINGGYPVSNYTELVWTAFVNNRKLDRGGLFRFPKDTSGLNYFLYPDGTQQRNKSSTVDAAFTAGINGDTKKNWHWEAKSSYGINSVRTHATNTNNASQTLLLKKNAPTSFYTGSDKFRQFITDINFRKKYQRVNLALGAEWRLENYLSIIGEEASWYNYDTLNYASGGGSGPENAVNKSRNITGVYFELEHALSGRLLADMAGRYEHYNHFGGYLSGKVAVRYTISKSFRLRASLNNGFREPSLQQRYLTSISEIWTGVNREVVYRGIFPNSHKVVKALNIPSLHAEKSINASGGITASVLKNINLAIDAYWIQIKNRIVLSGNFERRPGNSLDVILDEYPELHAINRVSFFTNAINTRTKGIDIIVDGNLGNKKESLGISLAANFNSTRLYGAIKTSDKLETIAQSVTILFNNEEKTRMEKSQPGSKIILSLTYKSGNVGLNIRNTRFGETMIAPLTADPEYFSSKILTDISLTYSIKSWVTVTLGANNVFNIYPDRLKDYNNTGQGSWIYSPEGSPFGFNGGYYFINLGFNFSPKNKNGPIQAL